MSQQPLPIQRSYLEKYKKPILVSLAIIIVIVILVSPLVPIQDTVLKTTARNLLYSCSKMFTSFVSPWYYYPSVNVTNNDSVGGNFTVTIGTWSYDWSRAYETAPNPPPKKLVNTCAKFIFISAGETKTVLSSNEGLTNIGDYGYIISAPSVQESHYENQTEYKSILNLIIESLRKQ